MKAQIIVLATALVVTVIGVGLLIGPTTKTVTVRPWQDAHCDRAHFEDKYENKYPSDLNLMLGPTSARSVTNRHRPATGKTPTRCERTPGSGSPAPSPTQATSPH
jgi:hypothetical protein